MKKLTTFLLTLATSFTLYAQSDYADCITDGPGTCLAAGGVVAVITVYTNPISGASTVLPIRGKMFDDVLGNPLWYVITNGVFGTNVTVLPFQDVNLPEGYMLYWSGHNNPPGYPMTYSSAYPIIVESSTGGVWSNEFYFCLYGIMTQTAGCGAVPGSDAMGIVEAVLYDGSNTNGLDNSLSSTTNSIMGRFGLGSCDARYTTNGSRASVSFVYFNLPPKPTTGPLLRQPWVNILSEPFLEGWCGFSTNTVNDGSLFSGFYMCLPNRNNPQNWRYGNSPCDSNPLKQFRVRFDGNSCCASAACASAPTLAATVNGGYMVLSFQALSGFLYKVDYQNNLGTSNWLPLTPWLTLPAGPIQMFDEMTGPRRFYRLGYRTNSLILP